MDHLSIDRFLKVWSEILSDHYDVSVKLTAIKKKEIAEKNIQKGGKTA